MKLTKFFIMFFILIVSIVACEKSTLKITQPEDSFFLKKMKSLNGFNVSSGGQTITTTNGTYTFDKKISGLAGIYKKEGTDEFMFVFPIGNEAHTVSVNEKEKKALEDIINIVGEENSASIIQEY